MKQIFLLLPLVFMAACSGPKDVDYCERQGVTPQSNQYSSCLGFFQRESSAHAADYGQCALKADETYPRSLYDRGRTVYDTGFGWGGFGRYHSGGAVLVGPDRAHNAQVDALRARIINPCMQEKGWVSGSNWEAGRSKNPTKSSAKPAPFPWAQ